MAKEDILQILFDELATHDLSWEDRAMVAAGVSHPMAILDLAEWLALHKEATLEEMLEVSTGLVLQYQMPKAEGDADLI